MNHRHNEFFYSLALSYSWRDADMLLVCNHLAPLPVQNEKDEFDTQA